MDDVKLILVLLVLLLEVVACSKKSEQPVEDCSNYPSPYEVEFPDNSIRKATVSACGGLYKATDLGQGNATIEANPLVIQLKDKTGMPYLTTFDGQ